ncbi:mycothione reductase [Trueperella bonasi]|uniref:Mycothione reductase n=1 Tax=Trueperella bonasi TaxID=312286 RepID=A0ABT9NHR0_9ACTO|nr:mycothione reductase [Trueperella bonasi]MDP9806548.1 mycothione reductase [Trueperella bonasi]
MHYDLVIIGSGSANSIPGPEFANQKIALIEEGTFGGTCLNVGCIPTKMFVHTADLARQAADGARFGLNTSFNGASWPAIRERIFGRIDPISQAGEEYRNSHPDNENLDLYRGRARFLGPKQLEVATENGLVELTADKIVIATGSRPALPNLAGIHDVDIFNNASVMRMEELPDSLLVLGSGYIAVEMAYVFSALGVNVTVVARSGALLRSQDADISRTYTELATGSHGVELNFNSTKVEHIDGQVHLTGVQDGRERTLVADELLVATGRIPNTDQLGLENAGALVEDGRVCADEYQRVLGLDRTPIDGLFTLGDASSAYMLKHIANHEMRVVRHNLLNPHDMIKVNHQVVPAAIFGHPQIGTVGITEQAAADAGIDVVVGIQRYADIAYGWAMEAPEGFAKIVAERETTAILGCHIIGPQAPTLVQLIVQAMATGQTARDIVRAQHWIHPAMPELIENALLHIVEG